jgi:hypothetical protein
MINYLTPKSSIVVLVMAGEVQNVIDENDPHAIFVKTCR